MVLLSFVCKYFQDRIETFMGSLSDSMSIINRFLGRTCLNIGNIGAFVPKYRKYRSIFLIIGVAYDSYIIYRKNRNRSAGIPAASLQMILSLIFCDVISSSLFRSPTVAPLVARQPFLKIAYCVGLLKADTGKVVFTCTTHISVFFLPSWCNFGNI